MKYADTIQSFDFALNTQAAANAQYLHTSKVLQSIPGVSSGPFGTTPDTIKASPEYKKAKAEYESAFRGLRSINSVLNSKFKKQYMAHIRAKREAELKGME